MKKILALLLLSVLILSFIVTSVSAAEIVASGFAGYHADIYKTGENITWELSSDGVLTFSGSGRMKDYRDVTQLPYLMSTSIKAPWWEYKDQIREVVVLPGITNIGSCAFTRMTALQRVSLPDGITEISTCAFSDDIALEEINIPDSVTTMGGYVFFFCGSLKSIELPDGITSIMDASFSNCRSLKMINIPHSMSYLDDGLFCNCTGLTSVVIPKNIKSIRDQVFEGCNNITSIKFEHDADDALKFDLQDYRYTPFLVEVSGDQTVATRIYVPDKTRINPAIEGYDWTNDHRDITYYDESEWIGPGENFHLSFDNNEILLSYGEKTTLRVEAKEGFGAISYQWYHAGSDQSLDKAQLISGAVSGTYTLEAKDDSSFGFYCCVGTDELGHRSEAWFFIRSYREEAEEKYDRTRACSGNTLGEVNSIKACTRNGKLHICEINFPDPNFRAAVKDLFDSDYVSIDKIESEELLNFDEMGIHSLKGIEFFRDVKYLNCISNAIEELDLTMNSKLEWLMCAENGMKELVLKSKAQTGIVNCNYNDLTKIDISGFKNLISLGCAYNHITYLDLKGNNDALKYLWAKGQTVHVDNTSSIDMSRFVPKEKWANITEVTGGTFNRSTGILTPNKGVKEVSYVYVTGLYELPNYIPDEVPEDEKLSVTIYIGALPQPKLSAIYNSSNGADIRFKAVNGAMAYVIERKENGVWSDLITVYADELEKEGNDLKYIDQSIKGKQYYGKGYIYSVAAIVAGEKTGYDTAGLALYRLEQPSITSVSIDSSGKCTASWNSTNAHGYELQYSSDRGSTWKKAPETDKLTVSISGLDPKGSYVFRLRSFKDNADRGRTYSQYSEWMAPGTASAPVMVTIYNSANGADIRWKPDGNSSYVIMRKENGVWKEIKTVKASALEREGGNYKYIDTEVKSNYGKGYIYSVAVKDSKGTLHYDTAGLALYRLAVPKITKAEKKIESNGTMSVTLTWNKVDAHGYEVQYSIDGGKTWKKVTQVTVSKLTIKGLDSSREYVFRIRCQKTNADRGTTWSQYSEWVSV